MLLILFSIDTYSDSDTSSESDYDSDQASLPNHKREEDNLDEGFELEPSEEYDDIQSKLKAQLDSTLLAELHSNIKSRAELPIPTYQKLPRSWPARPFDVRILPDYVKDPLHYFELFWTSEVWATLVDNTNAYAQYKEARNKECGREKKSR